MLRTAIKLMGKKKKASKVLLLGDKEATAGDEDEGSEDMSQEGA
jgi:hypothetical protein